MTSILIIDDEPGIRKTLASILDDEGYRTFTAEDALLGLEILKREPINLVFLDVLLPELGGMEALERMRREPFQAEVVVISGHANVDMAVRAVKLGAFDFLEKPLSLDKVLTVSRNALTLQKLRTENQDLKKQSRIREIIGASPRIEQVRELIEQAAASDARILISGENGTGKELAARAIHHGSARADHAFVTVNCAAIPDTLIESELFGHEKGAFTDAVSSRRGRFELADKGTLFLDEVGDMSLTAQAKVLRVVQEQKLERLGGEKTITVDVRIIAATNKDLAEECKLGRFRQDLYFRLNVIPLHMPALRERAADVPVLLAHFLREMQAEPVEIGKDAAEALAAYDWPGNIRELKNLAERITVLYRGNCLDAPAVGELLRENPVSRPGASETTGQNRLPQGILDLSLAEAKDLFEKTYLEFQLEQNGGVIARTAEAIGIYPSSLHGKLRKYGIGVSGNAPK